MRTRNRKNNFEGILAMRTCLNMAREHGTLNRESAQEMFRQMEKETICSEYYTFPDKPSSDGYYHLYLKDPDTKSGRRQIKARDLENLKEKVYEFETGKHGRAKRTFRKGFELVMIEKLKYVKDPEKRLSTQNTIRTIKSDYKRFFEGTAFEKLPVDEITKETIEKLCFKTLSKSDIRKKAFSSMKGILRSVLAFAYENYWIDDNPFTRVNFKKYNDMIVKSEPASKRVHSSDEFEDMLDYIHAYQKKKPGYIVPYALELQMLMGLRRGEVAPLTWNDILSDRISISREQLTIRGRKTEYVIVNHTKTYVDRFFPITDDIRDLLERLKQVLDEYYPGSNYLFPSSDDPQKPINNNVVYKFYGRMCRNLGIQISRDKIKGPHSFRRNGITKVCNSAGGNIALASVLYGNSPECASRNYYTGLDMVTARQLVETSHD